VDVLGGDPVGHDGPGIIVADVETDSFLGAGADKVLHEVHAAARAHPAVVGVRVVRLDQDVVPEKDAAIER